MATTRRPQINHKACSHAATPTARKACRKAQRAAEVAPAPTLSTVYRYSQTFNGKHVRYVKVIEDRGDKALVRYANDHQNNTSYEIDKSVLVAR